VTPLKNRAVSGSDEGFVPTHRYGRGSDLEVVLEVIGSADRLPPKPFTLNP